MNPADLSLRPSDLIVQPDATGRRWTLHVACTFRVGGRRFTIPAGFRTDFASVPRIAWRVLPPWDRHLAASVVHDWMYATGVLARHRADTVFRRAMATAGVPAWQRETIYWAVRLFGWWAWHRHRQCDS